MTYVDVKFLRDRYMTSAPTIWRWVREDKMPKPIKIGPNCTRWKLEEIEQWEASREVAQ